MQHYQTSCLALSVIISVQYPFVIQVLSCTVKHAGTTTIILTKYGGRKGGRGWERGEEGGGDKGVMGIREGREDRLLYGVDGGEGKGGWKIEKG